MLAPKFHPLIDDKIIEMLNKAIAHTIEFKRIWFDEDRIEVGKKTVTYAIIGLAVILSSLIIVQAVAGVPRLHLAERWASTSLHQMMKARRKASASSTPNSAVTSARVCFFWKMRSTISLRT